MFYPLEWAAAFVPKEKIVLAWSVCRNVAETVIIYADGPVLSQSMSLGPIWIKNEKKLPKKMISQGNIIDPSH